jgi:hypothetical protein
MGVQLFFASLQFGALDLTGSVVSDGDDLFGVRSQGATFTATASGPQIITASVVGTGQDLIGMYFGRAHQFSSTVSGKMSHFLCEYFMTNISQRLSQSPRLLSEMVLPSFSRQMAAPLTLQLPVHKLHLWAS